MKNLKQDYFNAPFSHVYVERGIQNHKRTKKILRKFPEAKLVMIDHYKDVFCRRGQIYGKQHQAPALILASKQGNLIYEGAAVCQSFGNEYFYYTSCIMNCIYDCEYCYLKGMYPSGNLVVFINIEDYLFVQFCGVIFFQDSRTTIFDKSSIYNRVDISIRYGYFVAIYIYFFQNTQLLFKLSISKIIIFMQVVITLYQ